MPDHVDPQVQLHLKKAREALQADFKDQFAADQVDAMFQDSVAQIRADGKFDDYVSALAERLTRERLKAVARAEGRAERGVPDVLFVALHDTARGQMGAAIMRSLAGDRVTVHSAGTSGARAPVDPGVAAAMNEIGIELDSAYSKPLTPEVLQGADVVVTMGRSAGIVEIPAGTRHIDWRIGDPGGAPIDEVRHIRDDIRARVTQLVDDLTVRA